MSKVSKKAMGNQIQDPRFYVLMPKLTTELQLPLQMYYACVWLTISKAFRSNLFVDVICEGSVPVGLSKEGESSVVLVSLVPAY